MSASDELRNLAESWVMNGDIPSYVKHDLDTLAIDVSEIERERDERRIVTKQEHSRVVQVYIDMLSIKNEENAKLRELVRSLEDERDAEHALAEAMGHAHEDVQAENDGMRELVRDMWRDGMCECDEYGACAKCEYGYLDRMRELGIEV